ncbi:MAG: hypothetical protein O7A98_01020 [Acidobacteria bacterium]|nr:hypothetical protein [Acidobacteriota bacterium]
MKVLGIRFCSVSAEAEKLAEFLDKGLGLPTAGGEVAPTDGQEAAEFQGCVFPAGESWIEVWPEGPGMPAGIMLQIVVEDADAWAQQARANGLDPEGPMDAHGERIYYLQAPTGLPMSFQSKLGEADP